MASTKEVLVKQKIRKILEKHGVYYAMPIGSGYGNSGVPDFLCCIRGHFLAIEAKAGTNKPTALQEKHLDNIAAAGGISMVVNEDALEGLDAVVERLKSGEPVQ